jgi:ComF family protein
LYIYLMQFLKAIFSSTLHLFYPHVCTGCGSDLIGHDNLLCLQCINNLPHTNFAQHSNNPIEKIFWGRITVAASFSQLYFEKESLVQHLIHQLKYKNNTAIGTYLGMLMGKSIMESHRFKNIDYLIPLPLFVDKEHKRGYNQATILCNGISEATGIPISVGNVTRQHATETQTRKHRTERWQNVAGSFTINNPKALQGKNILLVDDVITTGATIEACGSIILQVEGVQLFIAALAHAAK